MFHPSAPARSHAGNRGASNLDLLEAIVVGYEAMGRAGITVGPAACSDIHPMIQAAAQLRAKHDLTVKRIVRIEAEGPTKAATPNSIDGTTSTMAAQYSAEFNIAAAILADPADPVTRLRETLAFLGVSNRDA